MRLGEGLAAAFALRRRAFDWRQRLLFLGLAAAVSVWRSRGIPDPVQTTWTVAPDAFEITTPLSQTRLYWPFVDEVFRHRTAWIVVGAGGGYMVRRRMFPDEAAERAFIAALVARLAPGARARSADAARWAGS